MKAIIRIWMALIIISLLSLFSFADIEDVEDTDSATSSVYVLPIHIIEIFLALFISIMSLRFFRITRPLNVFLYIYLALGFFLINSLLFLIYYLRGWLSLDISFDKVYIGSRLSLIAMLIVFVTVFYKAHMIMKRQIYSGGHK